LSIPPTIFKELKKSKQGISSTAL